MPRAEAHPTSSHLSDRAANLAGMRETFNEKKEGSSAKTASTSSVGYRKTSARCSPLAMGKESAVS